MQSRLLVLTMLSVLITVSGLPALFPYPCYSQDSPQRMLALVKQLREQLKLEAAVVEAGKVIKRFPKCAIAYDARADLQRDLGHLPEALADMNSAIAISPKCARFIASRARIYEAMGKLEQATADFTAVLALTPEDGGIYRERGKIHKRLQQYDLAAADFEKAATYGKNNRRLSDIMYDRAQSYLLAGNNEKALLSANDLLKTFPDMSKGYWIRAQIYDKTAQRAQAADDRKKATALDMSLDSGASK